MSKKKKYLPYIKVYTIYASIALVILLGNTRDRDFWSIFIFFMITLPLIIGVIIYYISKYFYRTNITISNIEENTLFIKTWSLLDFAREFGPKMQIGIFVNKNTEKKYKKCVFTQNDGSQTYVSFFSQLGEIAPEEISQRKESLKIGMTKDGKYYLHNGDIKMWEDVDLFNE